MANMTMGSSTKGGGKSDNIASIAIEWLGMVSLEKPESLKNQLMRGFGDNDVD